MKIPRKPHIDEMCDLIEYTEALEVYIVEIESLLLKCIENEDTYYDRLIMHEWKNSKEK